MKKILSFAASIISLLILHFFFLTNSSVLASNIKQYSNDSGVLALMYHRFNENKYPSTNIRMSVFKEQIQIINNSDYEFYDPKIFENEFGKIHKKKKILISIDDAFKSFYINAWPYLRDNKIPFVLFVSTEPVGGNGYMTWDEIREIDKSEFGYIGHHSHTHDYLIDKTNMEFVNDIETASEIFKTKLGYVPSLFSYPFGEYSKYMKDYISKNFNIAFGQHSGVIDLNKERFELPRFPINQKYGDLERFKSLINLFPLEYKSLIPVEKKINSKNNPPKLVVEFFSEQKYIEQINCYSNDGGIWKRSNTIFSKNKMTINFEEPFLPRRGRINCSVNDGKNWRWFGTQFIVRED